jgi:hypothetical protein
MIKRFGEGVSMADIESFAVNRTLEEMKENARKKEISLFNKIKEKDVSNLLLPWCCYYGGFFLLFRPKKHCLEVQGFRLPRFLIGTRFQLYFNLL